MSRFTFEPLPATPDCPSDMEVKAIADKAISELHAQGGGSVLVKIPCTRPYSNTTRDMLRALHAALRSAGFEVQETRSAGSFYLAGASESLSTDRRGP